MALRPYLRLARVPTAGFTASVVFWGYFAARHDAGLPLSGILLSPPILGLLAAGVFAHLFGSIHNEICDRDIDARATYVSAKPLPSGQVSLGAARGFAAATLLGGILCASAVAAITDLAVVWLTLLAALCAAAYNRYGKRFVGGELIFSGSMTLFFFAGAAAVQGVESVMAGGVLVFGTLAFLTMTFQVFFVGGVKDVKSDQASGVRTVAVRLLEANRRPGGAQAEVGELGLVKFAGSAFLCAFLLVALVSLKRLNPDVGRDGLFLAQFLVVAFTVQARALVFLRALAAQERRRRLSLLAINEALQLPLFVALLLPSMTVEALALVVAMPVAVTLALNRTVYGMTAAPDV